LEDRLKQMVDLLTQDPTTPRAQAIAIAGGRILAVATNAEIRALAESPEATAPGSSAAGGTVTDSFRHLSAALADRYHIERELGSGTHGHVKRALAVAMLIWLAGCGPPDPAPVDGMAAPVTDSGTPPVATVNGVTLHYVDRGAGVPVVFVHGSLSDYREWMPVADSLASAYRTVTYSRRYNFPNDNPLSTGLHSALVEAEDLATLIGQRQLGSVHVVGVSYGAYTALVLAREHPDLVRSLVLVEPPLVGWLAGLAEGPRFYDEFFEGTWRPTGRAFERGDTTEALRITLDFFMGKDAALNLPPEFRAVILGNIREWQALTTSKDPFPQISRAEVGRIDKPVLMLSGGRTYPMLRLIDAELERQLERVQRIIVPDGTHDVCTEQWQLCLAHIRTFLAIQ
jgi:pimeloyl-ACP methyl ester carboxylesterase